MMQPEMQLANSVHPGLQRKEKNMAKRLLTQSYYTLDILIASVSLAVLVAGLTLASHFALAKTDDAETTLLVWAGDQAHQAPDFVAVIDFDADSPTYGRIVRTVPVPGPGGIGNEPHHVGLSADRRTVALGGLLSILRGQDQVFFFDVSNPRQPRFLRSDNPPNASIADEFHPLRQGGFLATFMGGSNGANPGRVVEYDKHQQFIQTWPSAPPDDGFNPHGIAIDEARNLMLTSDFICPVHTLHVPGGDGVMLRGSVRVWNLAHRSITRTITVGDPAHPAGTIDVQLIPADPHHRAFTAGMADNQLYLIDTEAGHATAVFDFGAFAIPNAPVWPQLMRISRDGRRLFVSLNYAGLAGKIVMLDIDRPEHPHVLSTVDLGPGSGPHYLRLTQDERRLVVSDYFLVEDLAPGGVVHAEGDHKVHVINVGPRRMQLDTRFNVDFNRDIATGPARPHGMVMLGGAAGHTH
jgi:selenium-binding protein 1